MIFREYRRRANDYLLAQCADRAGFRRVCIFTLVVQCVGSVVIYGALLAYLK